MVPIDRIQQNPYQPRKSFDAEELSGLGESIKAHGLLQPLVVRPVGDRYQLVAGERRLRAAQAIGFTQVPVCLVNFNDQQVLEAALVENIQRADLNPIEKAIGFKEYLDRFVMTQEELATKLGLGRAGIVGHDIGLMVAYAYAAQFPSDVSRIAPILSATFVPARFAFAISSETRFRSDLRASASCMIRRLSASRPRRSSRGKD